MGYGKIAGSIANGSVLALCALLPFFFIPAEWATVASAKMFLVLTLVVVATVALAAKSYADGSIRFPKSWLLYAAALVPIAYLISALAAGASRESFVGGGVAMDTVVAVAIWYALFVVCVHTFAEGAGKLLGALRMLVAGGAVVLVIQTIHLLIPSFTFGDVLLVKAASVVGSWHDFAIFLGFLFFVSVACLFSLSFMGWWRKLLFAIAVLSGVLLIIASFTDVWIALTILFATYGLFLFSVSRMRDEVSRPVLKKRAIITGVIAVAALGLYFGGGTINGILPEALQVVQTEVRPSWQGTYSVGSQALAEPNRLFFGSGPNTFPREWGLYKPLSVNETQFWNVDFYSGIGFIPTSFVTVGLLGAIAWGAVCLALLFSLWRVIRTRRETSDFVHAALVVGTVYLTAFHILYVPGPVLSALTFILFGFVVAGELLRGSTQDRRFSLSLTQWSGMAGLFFVVLFTGAITVGSVQAIRVLAADTLVTRAAVEYNDTQDLSLAFNAVETALVIDSANDRAHRAAVELGLLQLSQLVASGDTSAEAQSQLQTTLSSAIEHGLAAVELSGGNYQNWLSLARLYGELAGVGIEGAEDQARNAYNEALLQNPTNPTPLLGLAELDLANGDDEAARENLMRSLEIKPNFAIALFLLSQIEARAGNLEVARTNAENVARLVPEDSLSWYNLGTIYYAEENYEFSALAFEQALVLQNQYANAMYLLSASYAKLGRFEDAARVLQAVADLNPSVTTLPSMIEELEEGRDPFSAS